MKIKETITKYERQLHLVTTQYKEWKMTKCTNEHMFGQYETTIKMSKTILEELNEIEEDYILQNAVFYNDRIKSDAKTKDLLEQIAALEEENLKYKFKKNKTCRNCRKAFALESSFLCINCLKLCQ